MSDFMPDDYIKYRLQRIVALKILRYEDKKKWIGRGLYWRYCPAFIGSTMSYDFVTEEEQNLLELTKLAIRRGRFQKLPRDVNKLIKKIKLDKTNRVDQFHLLMKIVKSYPISIEDTEDSESNSERKPKESQLPEIIISESFS